MNQDGKTLIELMIVGAIAGLLAILATPNFVALKSQAEFQHATQTIAAELRLARQLAIARHERVRVVFDRDRQMVMSEFVATGTLLHTYRYADFGVVLEEPSGGPEVLFHPSGRSATATTIALHDKDGRQSRLTVGITGRVSIL